MNGARVLAESLKAHGVEKWFGVPGGHEILYLEIDAVGIESYLVRDEKNGALMADGYARTTFKPGICTGGQMTAPHLVTGMTEAYLSSIPVIAITSQHDPAVLYKNPHGGFVDHVSLFRTCTKWTHMVERADRIPDIIDQAFKISTSGRPGPVAIIVPMNALSDEVEMRKGKRTTYPEFPSLRIGPNPEEARKAVDILLEAENPVFVAGGGILLSHAWKELLDLAELMQIPVATTLMGKGAIPDAHPLSLGVVGYLCGGRDGRGKVANKFVKEADLVLFVGTKTDQPSTSSWTIPEQGSRIVHIDVDAAEIGKNYTTELGIVADAKLALKMLNDVLKERLSKTTSQRDSERVKAIKRQMEEWRSRVLQTMSSDAKPIRPQRVFRELQPFIDERTLVVVDAGSISLFAGNYLDCVVAGRTHIYPRGLTALGSGFPMALGAKVGAPDCKVFSLHGDGAFGYTIMELETAARHRIPVVSLVLNNKCLLWEKWATEEAFGEGRYVACDFTDVRFDRIAQAAGCLGTRVSEPDGIRDAIRSALDSSKPSVIEVMVDPTETPSSLIAE